MLSFCEVSSGIRNASYSVAAVLFAAAGHSVSARKLTGRLRKQEFGEFCVFMTEMVCARL